MKRPATWKVLTVGAAMTGLGVLGTGVAMADDTETPPDTSHEIAVTPSGDGDASLSESRLVALFNR
jgi:hypothetical protein